MVNVWSTGSEDKLVKLWDVETEKCLKTIDGHTEQVRSVAFSPDGKILASGSNDKMVKLWDVDTGKCLRSLSGHSDPVFSVAFSADGKTIAK